MMSFGRLLIGSGLVAFFWIVFVLSDLHKERRKLRGLNTKSWWIFPSEAEEYPWYSWMRYWFIIMVTHAATRLVLGFPQAPETFSLWRFALASAIVLGFFAFLVTSDRSWDKKKRHGNLTQPQERRFWVYWWLRYPGLVSLTVWATTFVLQL